MKVVRAICYLHKLWVLSYQVAHAQQISMLNLWVRQYQMRIVIDDNTLCKPPLTHFYRHEVHQIWKILDSQARLVTSCIFPSYTVGYPLEPVTLQVASSYREEPKYWDK